MYSEKDLQAFKNLGLTVDKEGHLKLAEDTTPSNMMYCGFNVYKAMDGSVFEKQGECLVPIESEEIHAEQRFIRRHLSKDEC